MLLQKQSRLKAKRTSSVHKKRQSLERVRKFKKEQDDWLWPKLSAIIINVNNLKFLMWV